MNIKHYDHRHQTVEEVRNCQASRMGGDAPRPTQQPLPIPHAEPPTSPYARPVSQSHLDVYTASEKTVNYVHNLGSTATIPQDKWPPKVSHIFECTWKGKDITMREADEAITFLKQHQPVKKELPDVPAGRYAVEGDDGVLRFYQIDRPEEGRWKGYIFASQLFGSPGTYRKERANRFQVLPLIAKAGIIESAKLYGQEKRECGVCHSPLTKAESRSYGIGPICRAKRGW